MSTSYTVKLEKFEGPLELLLDLIEKRKLFVNDISLAKVADDYIAYIKNFTEFPIGESAHFILIASTLLLIKSKSLLPTLSLTTEEQASIDDLEKRLKKLEKIRELSKVIKERFGNQILFSKGETKIDPVFSPDESINKENILEAVRQALLSLPKKEFLPKAIVDKVISLEDVINDLTKRVENNLRMSFKEFSGSVSKGEKVNVIISFLAMLELVKQGIIDVTQNNHFDDIHMETGTVSVPKY